MNNPELWRDLYVMLGGSSAALLGLLFVATSLHVSEITENPIFRLRARRNSIYLIITFIEAVLVLTPQPRFSLGIGVAAVNGIGFLLPLANLYNVLTQRGYARLGGFSIYRILMFLFGFFLGVVGGILIAMEHQAGLYLTTASYACMVVFVALNAWLIMLGVGQAERRRGKKSKSGRNRA
jgi:hypothetical protein